MATPETIGTADCENCGALVYVKKNRGGFPYYRCGACDHASQEHSAKGTRLFMARVTLGAADEDAAPEAGKKPENAAPAPAPAAPAKPAKSGFSTLLGGRS
jgi:hypothetical protein